MPCKETGNGSRFLLSPHFRLANACYGLPPCTAYGPDLTVNNSTVVPMSWYQSTTTSFSLSHRPTPAGKTAVQALRSQVPVRLTLATPTSYDGKLLSAGVAQW